MSFSSSQQVVEGDEVILFCNATGNPPPSIAWTKQGSKRLLSTSKTLHLTSLTRGDDGVIYKCKVENNIGSEEATATISVLCEYCLGFCITLPCVLGGYACVLSQVLNDKPTSCCSLNVCLHLEKYASGSSLFLLVIP